MDSVNLHLPRQLPQYWASAALTGVLVSFGCIFWSFTILTKTKSSTSWQRLSKYFVNRLRSWEYMIRGPGIIQAGFDKSNGNPYEVITPDTRLVFVSSAKHIDELDRAPDSALSLQAAANKMLQPRYTMHGFSWFDQRGTEGIGFERALRTLLTNHLPNLLPGLSRVVRLHFNELHLEQPPINGQRQTPVYPMMKKLVVLANAYSFLGDEVYKNDKFRKAALRFVDQTIYGAEVMRALPNFLVPIAGFIFCRFFHCDQEVFDALLPLVEQRMLERDLRKKGRSVPTHSDCIEWIIETSPKKNPWTAERVVSEILAIWFGSVHSLSITATNAIYNLSSHPEYIGPLREEIRTKYNAFLKAGDGLPLMDSFLKESARLNPVETMSTRRAAIKPFKLSDGTELNVGDWACTPVFAMMTDAKHYPSPLKFNGFRFVDPVTLNRAAIGVHTDSMQLNPSNFADLNNTYKIWGTGRMACPGRVYASAALKVIVAQIISQYDCTLMDPGAKNYLTWRSTMLPKSGTKVIFTPVRPQCA